MELGDVLSRAWKIIWKNKVFWIFGILASCSQSNGSSSNFNFPGSNANLNNGEAPFVNGQFPELEQLFANFEKYFNFSNANQPPWGLFIGVLCGVILLSLVFLFVGSIGRVGLIRGTLLAEQGYEPLQFGEVWSASTPWFWNVFLLNLLYEGALTIASLLVIVPLLVITFGTFGIGLFCLIPVICLLVPVSIALNVVLEQANIAMVVENLDIWRSIIRGWTVCRENLGPMAVVALVVVIGGGIAGIIISLPLMLVAIPAFLMSGASDQTALSTSLSIVGVMLCCLAPLVVFMQGVLRSYIGAIWTLTYLRLTGNAAKQPDYQINIMSE